MPDTVTVFDAARADLHPCMGCDACGMSGACCQKDDMAGLKEQMLQSDMVVFVTPLYYFGMSAQLKIAIDRFYSFSGKLSGKELKSALIVTAWDSKDVTMQSITCHYRTLCGYLNFKDQAVGTFP